MQLQVNDGRSVFAIGDVSLEPERFSRIDFTTWLYTVRTVLVSAKPRQVLNYRNLLDVFPMVTWLTTCLTCILLTAIIFIFVMATNGLLYGVEEAENMRRNAVIFPYASLVKQGRDN